MHINKSFVYNFLHPALKTGLLTSGGAKWQSRRKLLNPMFHFAILQQFVDVFVKQSEDMTNSLKNTDDHIVNDLMFFISEYTLNTICETGMSTSPYKLGSLQQQYRNAIHQMLELIVYRAIRPWLYYDWIFAFTPKGRQQMKHLKIINGFSQKIITERKLYHEQTNGQYLKVCDNDVSAENCSETITSMLHN
ncbi:cytochrome P450 4C1-like [Pogonomyrmex barbatus]|uniref:Cytochrome P450 4C1-like n=1 Tax=Pogonomyrmex barbatus TaxID=144034 RepID=A0A6I9WKV7_9HYME|nr:cytochrome P450 4C1-like [Pogonomyrmex barbatus]